MKSCSTVGVNDLAKRPICWNMHEADSNVVVVLVRNSSTNLENASIRTRVNMLPWASGLNGPMWSRWITSNGL